MFLYGEGPDNALGYEWRPYLSHLLARRRLTALWRAVSTGSPHAPPRAFLVIDSSDGSRTIVCKTDPWGKSFQTGSTRTSLRVIDVESDGRDSIRSSVRHIPSGLVVSTGSPTSDGSHCSKVCDITGALSHTEMRHPFLDLRLLQYHACTAGHAMVPEQTDHSPVDANGACPPTWCGEGSRAVQVSPDFSSGSSPSDFPVWCLRRIC